LADGTRTTAVTISIERVLLVGPNGNDIVEGPWSFGLKLPSPAELETALRTEVLEATVALGHEGASGSVRLTRSNSETVVEYSVPLGGWEVAQPQLSLRGAAAIKGPLVSVQTDATTMVARFPATDFGENVQVTIGPFEVVAHPSTTRVVEIPAGSVLAPLGEGQSVEHAPPIVSARYRDGLADGAHLLELTLDGAWPPAVAPLEVRAEDGAVLKIAALELDYSKGEDGSTQRERTRLIVKVPPESYDDSFILLLSPTPVFIPETTTLLEGE
jgi:hypothetical protein